MSAAITETMLDAVLKFKPDYKLRSDESSSGQAAWRESLGIFLAVLHRSRFLLDFDWMHTFDRASGRKLLEKDVGLLTLAELRKVLTYHVRMDKFCRGHLDELVQNGSFEGMVRRLGELKQRKA